MGAERDTMIRQEKDKRILRQLHLVELVKNPSDLSVIVGNRAVVAAANVADAFWCSREGDHLLLIS